MLATLNPIADFLLPSYTHVRRNKGTSIELITILIAPKINNKSVLSLIFLFEINLLFI